MDNISEIKQIIDDYLADDNTDYSIMITGQWGTGKTHFLKNSLEPDLDKELLYISLNGVSELQEIDKLIVLGLYPILKSKGAKIAGGLASTALKYFKLDNLKDAVELEDLPKKLNNKILCFDDLERSKIEIEQLLGYLNKFVEHLSIKTLLICNEQKISDAKTYKDIKEKIIGVTIEYNPDYRQVVSDIIELYNKDNSRQYFEFLYTNKDLIFDIFSKSETNNIRILKQSIIYYRKVYKSISDGKNKNVDNVSLFKFFLSVFFESRSNQIDEDELLKYLRNPYSYWMSKAFDEEKKNEKTYVDKFLSKYYDGKESDVCFALTLFSFIKTGYLHLDQFYHELDKLFANPEEQIDNKRLLTENYWALSDHEFQASCNDILEEIKIGTPFDQEYYLKVFYNFLYFSRKGALKLSAKELLDIFNKGIQKACHQWKYRNIKFNLIITEEPKDEEYYIFKDLLIKANEKLKELDKKDKAEKLLKMIEDDFNNFINSFGIIKSHDYLGLPVFTYWSPNEIAQKVLSLSNSQLVEFHRAFQQRYSIGNTLHNYISEIESLRELVVKFKDHVRKNPNKLSSMLLSELTLKISNTIEELTKIEEEKIK